MKAQGASYSEIIRETGIYKSICCLSDFFRNPVYLGTIKCGDMEVQGAHEPLVNRETWDKVQAQLYSRPRKGQAWPDSNLHPRSKGSPHLLSGLAHCIYCGASMIGETDRRKEWRFYMCGRKRREGWDSCEGSKMSARTVEEEVMRKVLTRVLTLEYVRDLVGEVNRRLADDLSGLDREIATTEREIAEKERAIKALLDLAETEGSKAAAERLKMREEERKALVRNLESLRWRREHQRIEVTDKVLLSILEQMAEGVQEGEVAARRRVLRQFVTNVEVGRKRGRLSYTFPLSQVGGLYLVPLEGFEPPTHCLEGSCSLQTELQGQNSSELEFTLLKAVGLFLRFLPFRYSRIAQRKREVKPTVSLFLNATGRNVGSSKETASQLKSLTNPRVPHQTYVVTLMFYGSLSNNCFCNFLVSNRIQVLVPVSDWRIWKWSSCRYEEIYPLD